jgi:hypothetical protein
MVISYSHQFIFFHIAKVGGLSIRAALEDYVQEPDRFKIARPPKMIGDKPNPLYAMWASALTHVKAREAQEKLPAEVYRTFYKFAFVRNPWDWQVSMYHFLLQETTNARYALVKSMRGFAEYLEWITQTPNPYPKGAAKFQKDMVTDESGQIIVDFIGRYETLARDFQQVCQTLRIEAALPYLNQTSHYDYRSYYTETTKKLVAEHFREDITLFGYAF